MMKTDTLPDDIAQAIIDTEQAAKTVDVAYHLGAGSSIWSSVPLQRLFRDVHVATQHGIVSPNLYELFGKIAFKLPVKTGML